jgi:glycosyltransferase involved in cell wall biosynthesis
MGLTAPTLLLRASVLARKERFRIARLWAYVVSTVHFSLVRRQVPQADVVVSVSDYFCDVLPAYWLKRAHPAMKWVACSFHRETHPSKRPGSYLVNWGTYHMQEWSFRRIADLADQVWVLDSLAGDDVARDLQQMGVRPSLVKKVQCGINRETIEAAVPVGGPVDAVMVGLRPNKGIYDIIPVWRELQKLRPGATLRLLGNRSDAVNRLMEEIRDAGLDSVISCVSPAAGEAILPPEQLFGLMKSASVFFAPSHEEGWGIAVCEAMACGLPVVAYDLPAYRRVYGEAIMRVPAFVARRMAESLDAMLRDRDLRLSYIERGMACARGYAWSKVADDDWGLMAALPGAGPQVRQ